MTKKTENEITVDSIHQAAYLLARQIPVIRVIRSGRFGIFVFAADKASPEIQSYIAGKATIEPRAYASAIRELRRMTDEAILQNGGGR
jgi:hypothetical protein